MIITGGKHVTPYEHIVKASVYRNYNNNEEDEVDGIVISSLTKKQNNHTPTAKKNKESTGKVAKNKNKTMIRKIKNV